MMAASFFDPKEYYTIVNLRTGYPIRTYRAAENPYDPAYIESYNTTDAENWQFWLQDGLYYIRNYHWGPGMQLGLTPDSKVKPQMHSRSADPGQQWSIRLVGKDFVMTNQLFGPSANFSLPGGSNMPGMYSGIGGEMWNITINESAAQTRPINDGEEWLSPVSSSATPSPTISSQTTPIPSSTSSSTPSPSTSSSTSPPPTSPPASSLSTGAIAGIVVGAVLGVGAIAFLLWFFLARRRKARAAAPGYAQAPDPYGVHNMTAAPGMEKYAHRSELPMPLVELSTGDHRAAELESPRGYMGRAHAHK